MPTTTESSTAQSAAYPSTAPLLDVRNLKTHFIMRTSTARAVDGVSFAIAPGETLGMVGESGCGKSVTALSILRLIPSPPGRIVSGEIWFKGRNLLALTEKEMRRIRGNQISMIFQEPMTSLNPVFTIGAQIAEVFRVHRKMTKREAMDRAVEMLETVRIPEPARRAREYPHQMSGGMRQRVLIAMALACNPALLIADEPTTALDVTVQAQILRLMRELQEEYGSAILSITHDLAVIAETARRVAVMYAGEIVEQAPVRELFRRSLHPYTRGLMKSVPRIEAIGRGERLSPIAGNVPDPARHPSGCRFHPRCAFAEERCRIEAPKLEAAGEEHQVQCHFWGEIESGARKPKS